MIYYTTDGSTPTTSSPVYSAPITISSTTTLKYFARDLAGNSEAVKSQTYTISTGTSRVTVELKDSAGNPLRGGVVQYYSGHWRVFGTTGANGQVSKELRSGSYTFRISYAFAHQEKSQDIATDPTVVFQTTKVTVQLKDSNGALMDAGRVQYRSTGWHRMGRISGGQASKELLPAKYTFRMTYGFAHEDKSQDTAADSTVVFQTGQVHSDSGRCTHYHAGGWHVFTQDMQLLPGTYTFRFKERAEIRSYKITAGSVIHIH
jgi:hypothetical protein